MTKCTLCYEAEIPANNTNTKTTKTKEKMLNSHKTNQCLYRICKRHNKTTLNTPKSTFRHSERSDPQRSTINDNCLCRHSSVAYFSAHSRRSAVTTLHVTLILLCCLTTSSLTEARSHRRVSHRSAMAAAAAAAAVPPASPIAASLLSNVAAPISSVSTHNASTSAQLSMSAHEKNSLELGGAIIPVPAVENRRALKLAFLNNASVVCNDGSRAGFYLRKNPNSKKWIVFLEGGWHCYDTRSCRARWLRLRHLMTSAQWPDTRDVGGILSPLAAENPYWHNANHVLVPYCSSDSWSGTRAAIDETAEWRFMGAVIIRQVIAELIPLGLGRVPGAELVLVGSSAGGLGVMLNLDRVAHYLQHERNLMVTVRGISDSGWFLDREPYTPAAVGSSESVRQGWKLWQGSLPEACTKQYQAEPWRCYFGYRLYPTLQAPLFVFQWLFDEAQMRADNVGAPVTPQQWNYIHEMGGALRSSLDNVTAVFAPSCIGHAVLSKRDWINIKIDDISLPSALRCWEHSTRPRRRRHNDKLEHQTLNLHEQRRHRLEHEKIPKHRRPSQRRQEKKSNNLEPQNNGGGPHKRLTKAERMERRRLRHERQQRRMRKQRERQRQQQDQKMNTKPNMKQHERHRHNGAEKRNNNLPPSENNSGIVLEDAHHNKVGRPNKHNGNGNGNGKNRASGRKTHKSHNKEQRHQQLKVSQTNTNQDRQQLQNEQHPMDASAQLEVQKKHTNAVGSRRSRVPRVPEKCALRLLERCSWPQCNHSCPMVTNPITGEEMRFLELLTSFGLDIEAVAAALGMDMQTLSNMDRTELVNLLTQQAS